MRWSREGGLAAAGAALAAEHAAPAPKRRRSRATALRRGGGTATATGSRPPANGAADGERVRVAVSLGGRAVERSPLVSTAEQAVGWARATWSYVRLAAEDMRPP